jgi:hypothetical protein
VFQTTESSEKAIAQRIDGLVAHIESLQVAKQD